MRLLRPFRVASVDAVRTHQADGEHGRRRSSEHDHA